MTDTLPPHLDAFVREHAGDITGTRHPGGGASRITWLIDTVQRQCVLRQDSGDGPVANTPLTLKREAIAYRALANTSVRIPCLLAETGDALLMEMAAGTPDLDGLTPEARAAVLDDYVDALADLHQIAPGAAFAGLDPPTSAADAAASQVRLWSGIYRSRVRRASPLAEFTSRWLERTAPTDTERLVICHGDVGPGNFLHDDERVTALLDWEFVHVGDHMDDLAWLVFRGHHFSANVGDFDAQLARWKAHTGYAIDRRRIAWYRINVMYIWLVSSLAALDNGAANQDRFTYLNLVTLMNVLIPRAVMEYEGRPVPDTDTAIKCEDNELSEALAALVDLLALKWQGDSGQHMYVALMTQQIHDLARMQTAIGAGAAAAVAELMGTPVAADDWQRAFTEWIRRTDSQRTVEVLYSNGLRRIQASPAVHPVADKPFIKLI